MWAHKKSNLIAWYWVIGAVAVGCLGFVIALRQVRQSPLGHWVWMAGTLVVCLLMVRIARSYSDDEPSADSAKKRKHPLATAFEVAAFAVLLAPSFIADLMGDPLSRYRAWDGSLFALGILLLISRMIDDFAKKKRRHPWAIAFEVAAIAALLPGLIASLMDFSPMREGIDYGSFSVFWILLFISFLIGRRRPSVEPAPPQASLDRS